MCLFLCLHNVIKLSVYKTYGDLRPAPPSLTKRQSHEHTQTRKAADPHTFIHRANKLYSTVYNQSGAAVGI